MGPPFFYKIVNEYLFSIYNNNIFMALCKLNRNGSITMGSFYGDIIVPISNFFKKCYTKIMQKIATRIFIYSSIVFGIIGILVVITGSGPDAPDSTISLILIRLLFATVFVILPSFALSIASKYLNDKS
jgi:hypothetical protein